MLWNIEQGGDRPEYARSLGRHFASPRVGKAGGGALQSFGPGAGGGQPNPQLGGTPAISARVQGGGSPIQFSKSVSHVPSSMTSWSAADTS